MSPRPSGHEPPKRPPCTVLDGPASGGKGFKVLTQDARQVSDKAPVVISKFMEGSEEIDIDAVANKGEVIPQRASTGPKQTLTELALNKPLPLCHYQTLTFNPTTPQTLPRTPNPK